MKAYRYYFTKVNFSQHPEEFQECTTILKKTTSFLIQNKRVENRSCKQVKEIYSTKYHARSDDN